MNCIKKVFSIVVLCFGILMTYAQQAPFGVKGTVVDVESYQPLAGVTVTIANSQLGTTTNDKGEFYIPLPSDKSSEYLIRAALMGYDAQELNFTLQTNDTEFVSFALKNADAVIEEVVVTRRREKFGELALLEERKKSNLMVESIGAQELSRKGVSDAQAALTKMAGVAKQDGVKNVLVRGLGDRYNSTSLNGLPLPSEDPLYKNISLDFFGSDIIQSINVNKTFNPFISGDVAGANVDIFTKEATANSLEVAVSGGVNTQTVGKDNFKRIDGTNWFGTLPAGSKAGITDLNSYDFKNNWNPNNQKNLFNSSFRVLGNRRFMVSNNPLSVFFVASMDSKYRYADGKVRSTSDAGTMLADRDFVENEYHVSKTAMLNLRYGWANSNVSFNSLYIQDQVQRLTELEGMNFPEQTGDLEFSRRQQVNDNHIFVNQLLSKLTLNDNWTADLGVGFNYVIGNEPDRRTNSFLIRNNVLQYPMNSPNENQRYYSDITEKGLVAKAILTYKFQNENNLDRRIDFGYNGNILQRDFNAYFFNHRILNINSTVTKDNVDEIFNNNTLGQDFRLETLRGGSNPFLPNYYVGKKRIHSAIANGTYQFNDAFTAVLGLRVDNVLQSIAYDGNLPDPTGKNYAEIKKNYFLPSLNLKYALNEKMLLRASGSQTYTLPQFIEIAPMRYADVNAYIEGNPFLIPAKSINADVKWELYPTQSELFSVGLFYKLIDNPIARVNSNSAGNTLTYVNVGSEATVFGAEVEVKKDLLRSASAYGENVLSAGLNVSYLFSDQKLQSQIAQFKNTNDKMEGASPLLVNADLTYKLAFNNFDLMPTVIFNYFSDRIYSLGTAGYNNIIEKGIPRLDFVTQANINKKWGVNLKAENILNPSRELFMNFDNGAPKVIMEQFKRGVDLSLGVSYKF